MVSAEMRLTVKNLWKRNKGLRNLIGILILIIFFSLVVSNILVTFFLNRLKQENYHAMAQLLGAVKNEYPEFSEEEWISLINNHSDDKLGELLLTQYGIEKGDSVSMQNKKWEIEMIISINAVLLVAILLIVISVLGYSYRRKKVLEQIVTYMQRVEQGEYSLDIEENEEEEFSILKNELYKMTILLKESAELSKAQKKALSDSVSDISHQLKTPLTSVMVLLDNMTDNDNMPWETRQKFLAEITRQLTGMSWLVVTLLKLSRLDAGVVTFEEKDILLNEVCEKAISNLEIMAQWKQIRIVKEGENKSIIRGDENWICEAFTNILKNAIEHSPTKSQIQVTMEENAVYSGVIIRDFGEGMDEEEQKAAFDRFHVGKYADNNSIGIGLSLAREIIQQQNGSITLHSEKGKGTWFHIKFYK